jgi:hypothetical protein
METQESVRRLAESCYALLKERSLPHGGLPTADADRGNPPAPLNLTSAIYHVSGATSFTFECPHGLADEKSCHVTLEQILGIQLTLCEAMMRWAIDNR